MDLVINPRNRMVHLPTCLRIHARPATVVAWDGQGKARACHWCMLPNMAKVPRTICRKCRHLKAQPCRHTGVPKVVRRGRDRYVTYAYADRVLEEDWLRSLLDS